MVASVIAHLVLMGLFALDEIRQPRRAPALSVNAGFQFELTPPPRPPQPVQEIAKPREKVETKPDGHVPVPKARKRAAEQKPEAKKPTKKEPPAPVNHRPAAAPDRTKPIATALPRTPTTPNAAVAGPVKEVELDVPFPFDSYTYQIAQRLHNLWSPAPGVSEGTEVVVFFRIDRSGKVSEISVDASSGSPAFDASAVSAVRAVERFSPLPDGFPGDGLNVRFHFKYRRG